MHIVWLVTLVSYQFEGQISDVGVRVEKRNGIDYLIEPLFTLNCYIEHRSIDDSFY